MYKFINIAYRYISLSCMFLFILSFYSNLYASRQKREIRIGRVNNSTNKITNKSTGGRVGVLVSGGTVTDIKKVVDSKYKNFSNCMLMFNQCDEYYNKCFDTTDANMKSELIRSREYCFQSFFSKEGNIEKIKETIYSLLSDDMLKLCTEDNNRQKLPNNGCQAMIINQSPGYIRYKNCIMNACVSMDGGAGNFAGCFGNKKEEAINKDGAGCNKVLSTYSVNQSQKIKESLLKEISDLEIRSCIKMNGNYKNGKCKLYVGYTRERSMTKEYRLGNTKFYAVTENGDLYSTSPKSFQSYPLNVPETSEKFFGKFEYAKEFDIGSDIFCSHTTFNLQKLFQYDSSYDSKYGTGMTGTADGIIGGGDMQLMLGAIGVVPAIPALFSKKEGSGKLNDQIGAVDGIKDSFKRMAPSIIGMATVSSNKGKKMRIGSEIKGVCVLQGGMSYNEGETIAIRWQ